MGAASLRKTTTTVRIDSELARKTKLVAAAMRLSVTDYLSSLLQPLLEKEHARVIRQETKEARA